MKLAVGTRFYIIHKDETKDFYIYCGKVLNEKSKDKNRLIFRVTRNGWEEEKKDCFYLVNSEWLKEVQKEKRLFITNLVSPKDADRYKKEYECLNK